MAIRIGHLDVRFEVEGGDDEAVFARLFERHLRLHAEREKQKAHMHRIAERNRRLGDRPLEDDR